jgi:acetyl-CoA/propionyl-CoA carboxylase biotin carboxyl carrier protein
MAEVEDMYDSAVREAVTAFGRGECFVERFLDRPRHVETQCLGDHEGNVVVVSTRDCSLQRRNQKLVEEAPAPFLTPEQHAELLRASKAILAEAGYVGAGTCEFLVGQGGEISFLEVNTRLQVEHPVTEEVTGIDMVREQLRIADGGTVDYPDPAPHAHSIEFRINGEDAGRDFLPAPGKVAEYNVPSGPGVRVDSGVRQGDTVAGAFDSMLAKLIVTGRDRTQALERSRRALDEFIVQGMPTVLPFHRAVVRDPAFAPADPDEPFAVHTRWIETEWDNTVEPFAGDAEPGDDAEPPQRVVVEVNGKRLEVALPSGFGGGGGKAKAPPRKSGSKRAGAAVSGDSLTSPMQGTVVKVVATDGDRVAAGDTVVVVEAMKMEQALKAHKDGVIEGLTAEVGQTVTSGAVLCEIKDGQIKDADDATSDADKSTGDDGE